MYSFSFLRKRRMQPYFALITLSQNGLTGLSWPLNSKRVQSLYNKIHTKCYFKKIQTHFSQDTVFIGCDMFPQVKSVCILLKDHQQVNFI